ncbi:hypothetical protein LCGC14_2332450 [marine sediment metagenome]|uniref:Uncharacterized protein n=1 Tax=marine sediment metagenome TaxID=412755 RepID=A0A0F9CFA5_9ZZZZ
MKITGYILIAVLLVWGFVALFTKEDNKIYVPGSSTGFSERVWNTDVPVGKYK